MDLRNPDVQSENPPHSPRMEREAPKSGPFFPPKKNGYLTIPQNKGFIQESGLCKPTLNELKIASLVVPP